MAPFFEQHNASLFSKLPLPVLTAFSHCIILDLHAILTYTHAAQKRILGRMALTQRRHRVKNPDPKDPALIYFKRQLWGNSPRTLLLEQRGVEILGNGNLIDLAMVNWFELPGFDRVQRVGVWELFPVKVNYLWLHSENAVFWIEIK